MPNLSIIIPVYQTELPQLLESVASVVNAAPKDSEIHIGFDGPYPEENLRCLSRLESAGSGPKLRISHFERQGLVGTLNALIQCSDCKYLARQDSDDICLPNRFEDQMRALNAAKKAAFCGTQVTRCDKHMQPFRLQRRYPKRFLGQLLYACLLNNPIAHPSLMIRREIINNQRYRDLPGAEDWDLYIRLWEEGYQSFNLDQPGLLYRVHAQQITQQPRNSDLLCDLKARSLKAAERHYLSSRLLKPVQSISNSLKFTEMGILAKGWLDR
jgi:glycosyltransferase involved in cell wall biosynthesis